MPRSSPPPSMRSNSGYPACVPQHWSMPPATCSAATSRGKISTPSGADHIVVEAAAKGATTHLEDPQAPALRAIGDRELLQANDAVDQAVKVGVIHFLCQVVDRKGRYNSAEGKNA